MGRSSNGLVITAAFAVGCAAVAPPSEVSQHSTGDGADLAGSTGTIVDHCADGGSCMTANLGDCSLGHAVCSGSVQSCVPDVTTQRCYSGLPATADVGACKFGTQTCIGALGSCNGEVTPVVENCFNDVDDDCDGAVNNGCPDHLVTGTPRALGPHGDSAGGTAYSLRCPANSYVTKIVVYGGLNNAISGLDLACATPALLRGASSYTVTPTAVTVTPNTLRAHNVDTTLAGPYDCGTASFSPGFYAPGASDPGGLDQLGLSCGAGSLTLAMDNKLTVSVIKGTNLGAPSGYTGLSGETSFEDDCAAGEVLVGFDGRYGDWFNETHAVCAPLQVVYK